MYIHAVVLFVQETCLSTPHAHRGTYGQRVPNTILCSAIIHWYVSWISWSFHEANISRKTCLSSCSKLICSYELLMTATAWILFRLTETANQVNVFTAVLWVHVVTCLVTPAPSTTRIATRIWFFAAATPRRTTFSDATTCTDQMNYYNWDCSKGNPGRLTKGLVNKFPLIIHTLCKHQDLRYKHTQKTVQQTESLSSHHSWFQSRCQNNSHDTNGILYRSNNFPEEQSSCPAYSSYDTLHIYSQIFVMATPKV